MSYVENETAYARAIENNIKRNRRVGGQRRWFAAHADAQRLQDWLFSTGEFKGEWIEKANGESVYKRHPYGTDGMNSGFIFDMRASLEDWGGLTDNQTAAVRKSLANAEARHAGREQARTEQRANDIANSKHVGVVGERREFAVKVERVLSFEGHFGMTFFNILRDADNNVIVYKGSNRMQPAFDADKNEVLTILKATVKAHEMRDGVAQTIIARPKVMD